MQNEFNSIGRQCPDDQPQESVLELDSVTKTYGSESAVENVSLSVYDGELLTLLGPSGCGKTTTLRLLAGLERPTSGTITIDDTQVTGSEFVVPEKRDVGIVFQDFSLFPHLTVAENIAFGLVEMDDTERGARVRELLELVDLSGFEDRMPDRLSGGQRQRVALARSLAPEPAVLLLDEPFSNLDVRLRVEMREEVHRILTEAGVTAVSVTHDQEEALSMSDRVAVLADGRIEQVGRPEAVFQHPESRFVAHFLGQASFLSGTVREGYAETAIGPLDLNQLRTAAGELGTAGTMIDILVRPDDLRATPTNAESADGEIVYRQYNGPSFVYRVALTNGDVLHCLHNHTEEFAVGDSVHVDLVADHSMAWYPTE